jgi:hypothetical protein
MVLFSILFIEPYYTSPKNVITNVIPLLLVFISIKTEFRSDVFWWSAVFVLLILLVLSIVAIVLENMNKSLESWNNKLSNLLKNAVVLLGQGKVLYSAMFLYFLLSYYSIQSFHTQVMFILWFFILCIDPKVIHNEFLFVTPKNQLDAMGEIFSVQSKKIFLVRLFEDKKDIKMFDVVKFRYSMQDSSNKACIGVVVEMCLLNKERWAKVLQLSESNSLEGTFEKNIVYHVSVDSEICRELRIDNFVGTVIRGSVIGKIRFKYSKKRDDLQEGDLIELKIGEKKLFYQVVMGITCEEKLEDMNETGFIEGEAIQLGEWQGENLCFQKFGWVPEINTPVFMADTSSLSVPNFTYPEYKIGVIPNTNLPSVIDLHDAVMHHVALLGITGSGKSFLARKIISEIQKDTKIICVDFNKEFVSTLSPTPSNIIEEAQAVIIGQKIDWINNELEKFGNQQDKKAIAKEQGEIKKLLKTEIQKFIDDKQCNLKVFELPDLNNTTGILDYTKNFFKALFEIAKEKQITTKIPLRICVVLEEAHTIVPEWNFAGTSDKTSQGLVNSIGQIALQGRKYGVGFLVIAQRTANVSKTVLTQCNTVICFRAFDETSFGFLGNYVGKEMVQTLPNLKQYHAIVTGKSVRSSMPMIVDLRAKD